MAPANPADLRSALVELESKLQHLFIRYGVISLLDKLDVSATVMRLRREIAATEPEAPKGKVVFLSVKYRARYEGTKTAEQIEDEYVEREPAK